MEQAPKVLNVAGHGCLAVLYLLPLVYAIPPNLNVILMATLAVFTGCLRTIGPDRQEVEKMSHKVGLLARLALEACCRGQVSVL